ncbi:MAG: hypothetical protein LWX56_02030 [Ignavibacteria bacterium]|nr:hypothetical protein [Ignavibacteria bacterium]
MEKQLVYEYKSNEEKEKSKWQVMLYPVEFCSGGQMPVASVVTCCK